LCPVSYSFRAGEYDNINPEYPDVLGDKIFLNSEGVKNPNFLEKINTFMIE